MIAPLVLTLAVVRRLRPCTSAHGLFGKRDELFPGSFRLLLLSRQDSEEEH